MLDYALKTAKKKGATDAVITMTSSTTDQIRFAKNTLSTLQTWETKKMNLFLSFKKHIVYTSLDNFKRKDVETAVSRLAKLARVSKPKKDFKGIAEGPFKYKRIAKTSDKRVMTCDLASKVETAIDSALKKASTTAGVAYRELSETSLLTSNNVSTKERGTNIEISLRAFKEKDSSGHAVSCSRTLSGFDPAAAGSKAGLLASLAHKPKEGETGRYDVLFDPLAFADILGLTASFSSAFYVDSGFSFLAGKLGKEVASPAITLSDAGNVPGGFGTTKFDAEGVPTQTTKIIDQGKLNTYLHNTSTAKKYLVKTTANAGLMKPSPHNVVLRPGTMSKDEIVHNARNALYVTNVWYTRFQNYRTGDFSTIPRDAILVIKNGEIQGSLKNIRIAENLESLLKKVTAVSDKPQWIHWWEVQTPVYLPYAFAEKVNITKPTM